MFNSFALIHETKWQLEHDESCKYRYKKLTKSTPYNKIIENIFDINKSKLEVAVQGIGENNIEKLPRHYQNSAKNLVRIFAKIHTSSDNVDYFHNSSSGYRAQYLQSPECGEHANKFAVDFFRRSIEKLEIVAPKRSKKWSLLAEASLSHCDAKIWIHQGLWLRYNQSPGIRLDAWRKDSSVVYSTRENNLLRWGSLCPDHEEIIEIKGGYVFKDTLEQLDFNLKPFRKDEIHRFGFT